jgi:Flp pilus assembly protein TadD
MLITSCLFRTLTTSALLLTLTACASAPVAQQPKPLEDQRALYAGKPAAVHGTEYPVASADEGITRGDAAWQGGDADLALYLYVQALQLRPGDAATLRKVGSIHEARGNRPLARRAYEMALAQDKYHPATLERLGLIYLQDDNDTAARELLERALAIEPYRWRSHNALGVLFDRAGLYAQALEHYDMALTLEPGEGGVVLNNRGHSRFLAGDRVGAQRDLRTAIERGATSRAWLNLGRVQALDRDYSAALISFRETMDSARALNETGEAAVRNGDHAIARTYFERATDASPAYFERAYQNLANVNEQLLREHGAAIR